MPINPVPVFAANARSKTGAESTTTRPVMKEVIDLMNDEGFDDVDVMVGGSCVTQNYADEIGADGYGRTASESAKRAKELVGA